MGRIKTSFVKRLGKDLYEAHGDKFTGDFDKNKKVLDEFIEVKSKKLRNILAGYMTNLKKQNEPK